jgi:hypothetical protein
MSRPKRSQWLEYDEAKIIIQSLGIRTKRQYQSAKRAGIIPDNIPFYPEHVYDKPLRKWRPFKEARKFVRSLKIKTLKQYKFAVASGKIPKDIPSNPNRDYPDEWIDFNDWLGNGHIADQNKKAELFFPFKKARSITRKLGIKSYDEWFEYSKSGKKPKEIPTHPNRVYKKQFISWTDWLGNKIGTRKREFVTLKEAKKIARKNKIKTSTEWKDFAKKSKMAIPINASSVYSK